MYLLKNHIQTLLRYTAPYIVEAATDINYNVYRSYINIYKYTRLAKWFFLFFFVAEKGYGYNKIVFLATVKFYW